MTFAGQGFVRLGEHLFHPKFNKLLKVFLG